ncbi:MAG: hypothetical protein QOD00_4204 [Blastocatellia bacterium]|nr:hypothetical protein [Blastocatellia bacterium]
MQLFRLIQRFFQFLSKTDQDALKSACCTRVARMTQTSLGIMVALTGGLAFFSGSYAIYTAFENHPWAPLVAVPLGILYSFMIIMFDREIVGAQDKRAVWFRFPLAIIIGFIVAVPLELRMLEDSINKQLTVASQKDNKAILDRMQGKEDELDQRKKELQDSVKRYRDEVNRWQAAMEAETVGRQLAGRTGRAGQGPAYEEAKRNCESNQAILARYEGELSKHESSENEERQRLVSDYQSGHIQQATDFLSRYEALDQLKSLSGGAFAISWGLRIFFILIEVFPSLLKLFLPYNEYNAIVEARMRSKVQLVHAIGNQQLDELSKNPPSYPQTSLLDALNSPPGGSNYSV